MCVLGRWDVGWQEGIWVYGQMGGISIKNGDS